MTDDFVKILVADDNPTVRNTVQKILEMFGHQVVAAGNGYEVLDIVDESFDVILLDIDMPGKNGFETIEKLNELSYEIPVIFLTGAGSMDNAVKALNLGAYDFLTKPIDDLDIFNVKIHRAIEKRAYVLQDKKYRSFLEEDIREKTEQLKKQNELLLAYSNSLENATMQILSSFQSAMEEKDYYTAGHTKRVTEYALMLGYAMELTETEMTILKRAAQLHDIGKLVIDITCIQKPGKLTDQEWKTIRNHPSVGANIVKPLGFMEREQFIIRHHHERIDGDGYPDQLKGDDLNLLTKIITVVDSYDAMTSMRNYKKNKTMKEAIEELYRCSGSQFDPEVVEFFIQNIIDFTPSNIDVSLDAVNNFR